MAKRNERYRKRRRKRRGPRIFLTLLTFCIVIGAIVASLTVFLKVAKIEVRGAAYYTNEQIIKSSEIQVGDNLFAINKFAVSSKILADFPYLESIKITRRLPDTFIFDVTERKPCGYIDTEDQRWIIDRAGYLLERVEKTKQVSGANIIAGEQLLAPKPGGKINWAEEEKRNALVAVLGELTSYNLVEKVREVNVSALYSIQFTYEDRLKIVIGSTEDIAKKFKMLQAVLPQLAPTDRGTVNLSSAKEARFAPESTQSTPPVGQSVPQGGQAEQTGQKAAQ